MTPTRDPFRSSTGVIPRVETTPVVGGAAGAHTLTGIGVDDRILKVWQIQLTEGAPNTFSGITDLTSEFSITAANTVDNTGGTATTGDLLMITWQDHDKDFRTDPAWQS